LIYAATLSTLKLTFNYPHYRSFRRMYSDKFRQVQRHTHRALRIILNTSCFTLSLRVILRPFRTVISDVKDLKNEQHYVICCCEKFQDLTFSCQEIRVEVFWVVMPCNGRFD
jgi:hypothetical protein